MLLSCSGPKPRRNSERLLDRRRVDLLARGEQGQRDEAGRAGLDLGLGLGPRTVGLLAGLEEPNTLANGLLDLLARDAARLVAGPGRIDDEHRRTRPIQSPATRGAKHGCAALRLRRSDPAAQSRRPDGQLFIRL